MQYRFINTRAYFFSHLAHRKGQRIAESLATR